jgi:hypothetical protein
MNKYQAYVRIEGQLVNTAVFADNPIHARLILQYQFGMDSLASQPSLVTHESRGYQMIDEVISAIKAKPPQTPDQARVDCTVCLVGCTIKTVNLHQKSMSKKAKTTVNYGSQSF